MDTKRVNSAVKIKIQIDKYQARVNKPVDKIKLLYADLNRLIGGMDSQSYSEFAKRIN